MLFLFKKSVECFPLINQFFFIAEPMDEVNGFLGAWTGMYIGSKDAVRNKAV